MGLRERTARTVVFREVRSVFPDRAPGLYYAPAAGRVGDVIPFYDGERFRIFHLYHADGERGGTTWQQVSTTDFVHFTQHGTMLSRGTLQEQDPSVATGSVIRHANGVYHAFYTGYNTPMRNTRPEQGVMHATSNDLLALDQTPSRHLLRTFGDI